MPLDKVGQEYAAMLYQKRLKEILANQTLELQKVVADFGQRNMMQSGMYLSARAKVMGRHVGLMAEAMAQTRLQAYERAGLPFNQAVLQEITARRMVEAGGVEPPSEKRYGTKPTCLAQFHLVRPPRSE